MRAGQRHLGRALSPSQTMQTSEEVVGLLSSKLQRCLNQIGDSDRSSRRRGLEALRSALVESPIVASRLAITQYFSACASEIVAKGVSDPVEKCRELSIGLIRNLASVDCSLRCVNALCERVGLVEPSEELRHEVLITCFELYEAHGQGGVEIAAILAHALADPYPEAKRAASFLAAAVARTQAELLKPVDRDVVNAIVANAKHQRARIRASAFEALSAVSPHVSNKVWKESAVPAVQAAALDRSPIARRALALAVGMMLSSKTRDESAGKLAGVLLELRADDDEETASIAKSKLSLDTATELFEAILIDAVSPRCTDWTREARMRGGIALCELCACCPEIVRQRAPDDLIKLAAELCGDDDCDVVAIGERASAALGGTADSARLLSCVLPKVSGTEDGAKSANGYRARYCRALAAFLPEVSDTMADVPYALAEHAWLGGDTSALRRAVKALRHRTVLMTLGAERDLVVAMLLCEDADEEVEDWWPDFADACARRCADIAKDRLIAKDHDDEDEASRKRVLLEAVIRAAPAACRDHFENIFWPLVQPNINTQRTAEQRVSGLALLHALVAPSGGAALSRPAATDAIVKGVGPNLVWQAGRTALTARKAALAVLHAILGATPEVSEGCLSLMPALRTCLEDYDASSRELALACLALIFKHFPNELDAELVADTYPALLKRLDDSDDRIRLAVCVAMLDFVRLAAKSFSAGGTALEYTLEQLLVHLDDASPAIQHSVFNVLQALVKAVACAKTDYVAAKIANIRASHRNPAFCNQLLSLLETLPAAATFTIAGTTVAD